MACPNSYMSTDIFIKRRKALLELMAPNSALIIASGIEITRSRDTHYSFRPDSDFYYLTGFNEPESWLVLRPGVKQKTTLFCRPKDKKQEIWEGYRLGEKEAVTVLAVDKAMTIKHIDKEMPKLLQSIDTLYFPMTRYQWLDEKVSHWVKNTKLKSRKGTKPPKKWSDSDSLIHEMRLIKSPEEIDLMKKVCEISAQAHIRAMEKCRPGLFEYQLEAEYQHEFLRQGCTGPAYTTIVGGGNNACVLHYTENKDKLNAGELVLVDAGGELDCYAGDITRTFPVNGRFSKHQKEIYNIVLNAQTAALKEVKPGNTFDAPHQAAVRSLTESLIKLGWIEGPLEHAVKKGTYKDFYMHRTGHWLGLDVHDVGDYKLKNKWRKLEPGMCLTIEPGLYIEQEQTKAPKAYRGIGIRIEDDVLVTDQGYEVLTASVPKTVSAIENLMKKSSK